MILSDTKIITPKDVMKMYGYRSYRSGLSKIQAVRRHLNKNVSNAGKKGADPITFKEFREFYKI